MPFDSSVNAVDTTRYLPVRSGTFFENVPSSFVVVEAIVLNFKFFSVLRIYGR